MMASLAWEFAGHCYLGRSYTDIDMPKLKKEKKSFIRQIISFIWSYFSNNYTCRILLEKIKVYKNQISESFKDIWIKSSHRFSWIKTNSTSLVITYNGKESKKEYIYIYIYIYIYTHIYVCI